MPCKSSPPQKVSYPSRAETDSRNFQFRHYSGSLGEKGRLHSRAGAPYSPIIEVDEDSHSKYVPPGAANIGAAEEMRGGSGRKHGGGGDDDDLGWDSPQLIYFILYFADVKKSRNYI